MSQINLGHVSYVSRVNKNLFLTPLNPNNKQNLSFEPTNQRKFETNEQVKIKIIDGWEKVCNDSTNTSR